MKKLSLMIFLTLAGFSFYSCQNKTISGNGNVIEKAYSFDEFHSLSIKGAFEIHLIPSNEYEIKLISDENIIPEIKANVDDSVLEIYPQRNIVRSKELKLCIYCPEIKSLVLSGASEIISDTFLISKQLNINISGTGKLLLKVKSENLNINISGGAEMLLQGESKQMYCSITGIGNINADNMLNDICTIDISGYGRASVNAKSQLNINISGFGKILYHGNPNVKQNITGSAKIKQVAQ
jgi:hypothetical protein